LALDDITKLINAGEEKGYLTYNEVNDVIPHDVHSPEALNDLLTTIDTQGIDVLDGQPKLLSALEKSWRTKWRPDSSGRGITPPIPATCRLVASEKSGFETELWTSRQSELPPSRRPRESRTPTPLSPGAYRKYHRSGGGIESTTYRSNGLLAQPSM
jgi:hypothetical protein